MAVNYVVNAPATISIIWRMVKGLLDAETASKVHIQKGPYPISILSHTASSMIERKYGG